MKATQEFSDAVSGLLPMVFSVAPKIYWLIQGVSATDRRLKTYPYMSAPTRPVYMVNCSRPERLFFGTATPRPTPPDAAGFMAIEVSFNSPTSCSNGPPTKEVPEAPKPRFWRRLLESCAGLADVRVSVRPSLVYRLST